MDIAQYQAKRDFMYDALTELGYDLVKPQGAFYMFPKAPIEDDVEFVAELQKHNVLTVPGMGFGMPGLLQNLVLRHRQDPGGLDTGIQEGV